MKGFYPYSIPMKLLVISDTHLNLPVDENKFELLKQIISDADQVIINGDFWEGFLLEFDEFFSSSWSRLFPPLKEKQAVYIFGNHDDISRNDPSRISAFSDIQTKRYEYSFGDTRYIFEHGHRFICPEKYLSAIGKVRFQKSVRRIDSVEKLCIGLFGRMYQKPILRLNRIMKKKLKKELKPHEIFICGHTHAAEYNPAEQYINSGVMKHGLAQYLIIKDGVVTPYSTRY